MKELIFSLIYLVLGGALLSAYYFDQKEVFALFAVIYFVILTVDYTND